MRKTLYIISFIAFFIFLSCSNDDDFSSDSNIRLTFSSDTISFDTVFTTIASATKEFRIYNKNKKSAVIQSIELMNPEKSGFRMNIDGEKGTKLNNIEILKKDSLFGFVEVTVDPQNTANPVLIRDSIKFEINGNVQYLQLQAIGQDVYIWKGEAVTKDSIFTATKPVLVYDSIVIKENVNASITEGVRFFLKKGASINVHGTLNIEGSTKKPVIFRSERFDKIEGDIPYDNVPGEWSGIYFFPESYENKLENVFVRGATRGMTFYASDPSKKKASLYNTIVHNNSQYGVLAINCNIEATNCIFSNSPNFTLGLQGGVYSFTHCTIANYYNWSSRRMETLAISNYKDDNSTIPLSKCDFINCIVYGSVTNEVLLDKSTDAAFEYQFINCLLKGTATSDSHFPNVIWNEDPLFVDLNKDKTYSYNFELQETSPARNKADKTYSLAVPYDLKGNSRLADTNPDMGCYEWKGQ
ncbi:MAG: choice-of-anchor Q domain-containing protein [Dysgonomonas sp.]|nr:choice-of-anchor Q domain-containing protein [Dysgonomonas sp.]